MVEGLGFKASGFGLAGNKGTYCIRITQGLDSLALPPSKMKMVEKLLTLLNSC